jgi:hypothetical protein
MKFLVLNYCCLQNPWLGATAPRSPFSLSSTEFVEPPPPEQNSWARHCVVLCSKCTTELHVHSSASTNSVPYWTSWFLTRVCHVLVCNVGQNTDQLKRGLCVFRPFLQAPVISLYRRTHEHESKFKVPKFWYTPFQKQYKYRDLLSVFKIFCINFFGTFLHS